MEDDFDGLEEISKSQTYAQFLDSFVTEEDKKYLESSERQDFFYRVWVMKESYVKWTGDGITRELHSLPMDGWHQFLYVDHRFASCIWAKMPLEVVVAEVRERDLNL